MNDTKPICCLCKKIGDEKVYWWISDKRGKTGKLAHMSCCYDIQKAMGR